MFLQIHTLTSFPAALLNRDDAGLAKRIPFGDATRIRISSQCLKRHWRDRMTGDVTDIPDGLRTRYFFSRALLPRLREAGVEQGRADALCSTLARNEHVFTKKDKGKPDAEDTEGGGGETPDRAKPDIKQPVLFGLREADYFLKLLQQANADATSDKDATKRLTAILADKEQKANLSAMYKSAAGLTAALFGRFVTSDILARVDAPVHVAHAFTVHAAQTEMDYFTVVDDLNRADESGAAHANETELGAGLFYGYVAVDVPLLVSNLVGCDAKDWRTQDHTAARRVLNTLIRTIAEQSPGAKLGSTAPFSRAACVLLETGTAQPRSLANAYLEALHPRGDAMQQAVDRMARHLVAIDGMYGATADTRTLATIKSPDSFAPLKALPLATATAAAVDAIFAD